MGLVGFYRIGVNRSDGQFQSSALAVITVTVPYKKFGIEHVNSTRDNVRIGGRRASTGLTN
jgi:hypothetical protein